MTVIIAGAGPLIEACFVWLGRMGSAMAAALAAGGCRVIAAVGDLGFVLALALKNPSPRSASCATE